jgi:hypothetical protein
MPGDFEPFSTCHSIYQFCFSSGFFLPLFPFLIPVGFLGVFPLLGSVKVASASWLSVFHFPFLQVFVIDETW